MLGATQAGMAFCNSSVALVHGMSRPIGARFHVPHGLSNAMLLPAVTRFGLDAAPAALCRGGPATGFAAAGRRTTRPRAARCAGAGRAEPRAWACPARRPTASTGRRGRQRLDTMADQALASGSPANNPRVPDKGEIVALYRQVFAGSNA